ncbi:MAG: ATP-binding cassette domain-containing protein [Gammaproteobacteria bacterium]
MHDECVCLEGPSGAGKTLLLRAIADLDLHQGRVYLDDIERNTISGSAWRRQVGLLPAESQWWRDTVGEHFEHTDHDLLDRLGFDNEVMTWQVSRLSSGERQRLALVRMLSLHPRVLLLDEPTASLDPDNVQRVEEVIKHYRNHQPAAVLWVSHDPQQIARVANRSLYINKGQLLPRPDSVCIS